MRARSVLVVFVVVFAMWYKLFRVEHSDMPDSDRPTIVRLNIWHRSLEEEEGNGESGPVRQTYMTAYEPPRGRKKSCGVLVLCGGGYGALNAEREGHDVARWLVDSGYTAFVLEYRIADGEREGGATLEPFEDVFRAVTIVHAEHWRLHTVGVLGVDAGAHMAAMMTSGWNGCDPTEKGVKRSHCLNFAILLAPLINLSDDSVTNAQMRERLLGKKPSHDERTVEKPRFVVVPFLHGSHSLRFKEFSADLRVSSKGAPTFIVHSEEDTIISVRHSKRYVAALSKAGVDHEFVLIPGSAHDLTASPSREQWAPRAAQWIEAQCKR